uniref:Putative breast cancer type 2 susceptibility protein n=1 Tax=Reticulitermes speratus TaxID=60591 RepID=A0A2Z5TRX8_9NEOP
MEDCDLPENRDQSLGLYELLKKDIEDLGVSSPDWWHEAVETKETSNTFADKGDSDCTSEVCGCRSPVFKTPQVGLKSKRNRKSCDRLLALSRQRGSRVTSPDSDGSSEVDWYSPFKSSKLSPIPPLQMGGGAIPESLEPLLEEGSDMSWNSAFATPLASSVTFSGLTSSEKKVLMPHNSHRNPRVLFLGDESMDLASCSKTIDLGGEEMSQKAISDTAMLDENSFVDKTEFNMQDSVLSCKENILCCSTFRYKTNCNKNVDSPVTGTVGNLLEEKSSHSVTLSMDIIQKCDEAKDTETHFQGVKSDLVQYRVQEICSSGSGKERSQYNVLQRHSFIKSPDSGMNDFTENSAEIDFGNSSLVSSISARVAVPRRLFHGNRRVGVHEEAPVTQHGVARAQIEDSGAVACDEISQGRSSGSVGTAKWSQYDSVVSNEVATSAVHSTEDFPQDLSINTLEEICQVTELLAADTDTPIEFSQNPDNTDNNKETPVCVQLSSPDKSCLCRTSTPIHCRNKHSKLDSGTRKKRIKFVHVNDSEKLNKRDENVRIVKENIQKQCEFEEWQHGGNSALEQSVAVLDNNSVVDISSRVQTIKKTLNQNKKFTYVLSNVEMKATLTQDNGLNVLMEDVVKSAQAMENVVGTKVKHNNVRKFSAIASDRKGFIPFCKLDGLPRFVTKGESSEDFKITNGVTDTSYSMGEPILRSCNRSLSSNTGEACDQAISTGNLGNINKSIDVGGGTNAECKNICFAQCDSGTGVQEQSCILIKDARATRKFKQSSEAEEPCNTSDTRCDIQGDFSKQLHEFPSGSKNEMRYEFSRPNQTTEKFGFKNNTGNQIRLSNEALLKNMRLIDGIMIGEKVQVSPDMTFRVPGQDSKREELKDMKVSAVHSPYTDISCEQSNATPEYKSVMFDEAFRQGHILNKHNSSLICTRNINKQETVRRVQTEAHQNCNWNETATEENTLTCLEDKREGENMVTDLQIVLAAEVAELMQQLVEDGSMYSQWPSEVHSQEMEVCEKINNPATETKYHICACGGKGNAEQKESCACSHVTREPQEDVSMSDGSNKSLFSKLTSLCPSSYENVEVSERNLQQTGQRHQNDIICDSTEKEGNESSMFNKVVQIMNFSDNGSTNQIKKTT